MREILRTLWRGFCRKLEWFSGNDAFDAFASFTAGFTGIHNYPNESKDAYIARTVDFLENLAHSYGGETYAVVTAIMYAFAGYLQLLTGQRFNSTTRYVDGSGNIVVQRIRVSDYIKSNVAMGYAVGNYGNREFVNEVMGNMLAVAPNPGSVVIEF